MEIETYKEAAQLISDISAMDKRIEDVERNNSNLTVSSNFHYQLDFSSKFSNEILGWLKSKREEYQKRFDKLK